MATMNLRTKSRVTKGQKSRVKPCEELPALPENHFLETTCCNTVPLIHTNCLDLDQQIVSIRKVIQDTSGHSGSCGAIKTVVYWYYNLPSSSSLTSVIVSCLNKVDSDGIDTCFSAYIYKQLESSSNVSCIQRCFDGCQSAFKAVFKHRTGVLNMLKVQIESALTNVQVELGPLVRTLLSVQSQHKKEQTGLLALMLRLINNNSSSISMTSETKSNIALFVVGEAKVTEPEDYFLHILDQLAMGKLWQCQLDSSWILHLANALVIVGSQLELFEVGDEKDFGLSRIFGIIEALSKREKDSALVHVHSNGALLCVTKLYGYLSCVDVVKDNIISYIGLVLKLEKYVMAFVNFPADKIRHNMRNILNKVVSIYNLMSEEELRRFIRATMALSWEHKYKSVALTCIGRQGGGGCAILLNECPDLPEKVALLLKDDPTMESICADLYEALMKSTFDKAKEDWWLHTWIKPIMSLSAANVPQPVVSRLVTKALERSDKALQVILLSAQQRSEETFIKMCLTCLKINKLRGGSEWNTKGSKELVQKALIHLDDCIRLQALDLIVSSKSSREDISVEEQDMLLSSVKVNLVLQGAARRQDFVTAMKKLFQRLHEAMFTSSRHEKAEELKPTYGKFLVDVCTELFKCLFVGANFSRRVITLECLHIIFSRFGSHSFIHELHTRDNADKLLYGLRDSYENNKRLSAEILCMFPTKETQLDDAEYVEKLWMDCMQLCHSHKPPDSISAGHIVKFIQKAPALKEVLKINKIESSSSVVNDAIVERLLALLRQQVDVAKVNLGQAALNCPMYGVLFCLRTIISTYHEQRVPQPIRERILAFATEVSDVLGPVLNNNSPEGHIPMDLDKKADARVSAQLLLLCSWRTSKEISLICGDLCPQLNTQEQLQMCAFFTRLLSEIKHRGAFEQAYIGFCQVCSVMWKSNELSGQPVQMLQETLSNLKGGKHCSTTRRSAGVPFLIQAVVSTEPNNEHPFLRHAMQELLTLARDKEMEVRVHAYNILRVLYRDSLLGDSVTSSVSAGVEVAVEGFKSALWSERNAATLLFSSLCTRIFGVKRSKHELSKKNAMSARAFFNRYPELYSFLLQEVTNVSQVILQASSANAMCPEESSVYPILLILAKLQAAPVTEGEENVQLTAFLGPLTICCGSSIYKIRELAAIAVISIVTSSAYGVEKHLSSMFENKVFLHNQLHGYILQLKCLAEHEDESVRQQLLLGSTHNWDQLVNIAIANVCPLTSAAILEVLVDLDFSQNMMTTINKKTLKAFVKDVLFGTSIEKASEAIWRQKLSKVSATIYCYFAVQEDTVTQIERLVNHKMSADVRGAALEFINQHDECDQLLPVLVERLQEEQDLACLQPLIVSCLRLTKKNHTAVMRQLPGLDEKTMEKVCDAITYHAMNGCLAGLFIEFSGIIVAAKTTNAFEINKFDVDFLLPWCLLLRKMGFDEDSHGPEIRLSICKAILTNVRLLAVPECNNNAVIIPCCLWPLVLWMSNDDDEDIRKLVHDIYTKAVGSPETSKASTLVFQLALSHVLRSFDSSKMAVAVLQLFALNTSDDEEISSEEMDEQAFDKSEMNLWREDQVIRDSLCSEMDAWLRLMPDEKLQCLLQQPFNDKKFEEVFIQAKYECLDEYLEYLNMSHLVLHSIRKH